MIIAGIGARVTPTDILPTFEQVGMSLAIRGIAGRSGCADGPDSAFERGYRAINPGLFKGYPGKIGHYVEWQEHAARFHPVWNTLSDGQRAPLARNSAIMCGDRPISAPEPVDAVLCWTEGGAVKGGTGQSLRIAAALEIPVFNLCVTSIDAFWSWVASRGK